MRTRLYGALTVYFVTCAFRMNLHSVIARMSRNSCSKETQYLINLGDLISDIALFWARISLMFKQSKSIDSSNCNGTQTHNHLVCKQTLNHLTTLAKWLSCLVCTHLYGAFDCMFLSCHVRVSRTCFEQGVPWYSGKYRVLIHSEMRTWHEKNMQSNAPYR